MKLSGTGRIVLWRGGSLWIGRVGEQTGSHVHHAVQVTFGLSGRVRFREPGGDWVRFQAALIPAHQAHMFDAPGETAVHVFVEPESREGRVLQLRHRGRGIQRIEAEVPKHNVQELRALFEDRAADAALVEAGAALIRGLAGNPQGYWRNEFLKLAQLAAVQEVRSASKD